jgi:hypothetical protein
VIREPAAKPRAATVERKPTKPKPKRAAPSRPRKPESKEQPWNDDSPFMPVATPKR